MSPEPTAVDPAEQVLYLPEEAARRLRVTRHWLMLAARQRRVPHRRVGRIVRFADEDLAAIKKMLARPAATADTQASA